MSVEELEDVAASPASSVLSAEQAPVLGKPATVLARAGRGLHWIVFLSLSKFDVFVGRCFKHVSAVHSVFPRLCSSVCHDVPKCSSVIEKFVPIV